MENKKAGILIKSAAIFLAVVLILSIFTACGGKDSVTGQCTVTVEGGTGGGTYAEDTEITVVATVPEGKIFVEWQEDGVKVSDFETYTFTVTKDVTLTAVYENDEPFVLSETYSVLAVGDVHVRADRAISTKYLKETLEYVRDNGIKVFVSNGDFVNCGDQANYDAADAVIEEVFEGVAKEDMPEFIFNMGNHEFYPNNHCRYEETDYETGFEAFRNFANKWMSVPFTENDNIYLRKIAGVNYVAAFGSRPGKASGTEFTEEDFLRIESLLKRITKNNAPCVFLTHCPWGKTYGGQSGTPSSYVKSRMTEILADYPSVISLTSHTHFSSLHERTFDQGDYTTIALGSQVDMSHVNRKEYDENGELIAYDGAQETNLYNSRHFGMRMDFGEEDITVVRIDLTSGEEYSHGFWTIPYGITKENKHDKFYYENGEREGTLLHFGEGSELSLKLSEYAEGVLKMNVGFSDVEEYYAVEGYKIEIYSSENVLIKTVRWQSLFWTACAEKKEYTAEAFFSSSYMETQYTVKVYPMDFFGRYGEPLVGILTVTET